jgi:7-cyano-7-deazaguanine reductase
MGEAKRPTEAELELQRIYDRVRNLKLVFTDKPQPELVIPIPNQYPKGFKEKLDTFEFTSLCPFNPSQPDFAHMYIEYAPNGLVAELKSLKMYLASYRMVPVFHEMIPNQIVEALYSLLKPEYVYVRGEFTIRGGIQTTVEAGRPLAEPE